jgi:hypothetical protein
MRLRLIFLVLALSAMAWGQGSVSTGTPIVFDQNGQLLQNATVAVCTNYPGLTPAPPCGETGNSLATLYTDITLGTACSGTPGSPLNNVNSPSVGAGCSNPGTPSSGNVIAYSYPGSYWCEFYGSGFSTLVLPCVFPTNASILLAKNINGVLNPTMFTGTGNNDIGDKINAAAASCSNGCAVYVSPTASCQNYSTPIVINTPVTLTGAPGGGSCLNFTPAYGVAITFNGGQQHRGTGARDLKVTGACTTTLCSGVTAQGIVTNTTLGADDQFFLNVQVGDTGAGFLDGWVFSGTHSTFLSYVLNSSAVANNVGALYSQLEENNRWVGGVFAANAVGVSITGAGNTLTIDKTSFDANSTCAIQDTGTNGWLILRDLWFENPEATVGGGVSSAGCYLNLTGSGTLYQFYSLHLQDDCEVSPWCTPGTITTMATISNAAAVIGNGGEAFSQGRVVTEAFNFTTSTSVDWPGFFTSGLGIQFLNEYNPSFLTGGGRLLWCPGTGTVSEVPCRFNSYAMQFDSITSNSANPASSGFLALAANDKIGWRNNAADCLFGRTGGNDALGWGCGNFYFSNSKGQHFQNNATNSDADSVCTLASGTCSFSFTTPYGNPPNCVASVTTSGTFTLGATLKINASTSGYTVTSTTGTDTAGIAVHCAGNPF